MKNFIKLFFIFFSFSIFNSCVIELPSKRGAGFNLLWKNASSEDFYIFTFWCMDDVISDEYNSTKAVGCKILAEGKSNSGIVHNERYDIDVKQACLIIRIEDSSGNVLWQGAGWPEEWKTTSPDNWKNIPDKEYDMYGLGFIDYELNNSYNMFYMDSTGNLIDNKVKRISYDLEITEDKKVEIKKGRY